MYYTKPEGKKLSFHRKQVEGSQKQQRQRVTFKFRFSLDSSFLRNRSTEILYDRLTGEPKYDFSRRLDIRPDSKENPSDIECIMPATFKIRNLAIQKEVATKYISDSFYISKSYYKSITTFIMFEKFIFNQILLSDNGCLPFMSFLRTNTSLQEVRFSGGSVCVLLGNFSRS